MLRRHTVLIANQQNAKTLSLSSETHTSPIQVYHCFNSGISLLHCLALQGNILPNRLTVRAIIACSSALAIHAKTLSIAWPFLQLFEKLSDPFLGNGDTWSSGTYSMAKLGDILRHLADCQPSEVPEYASHLPSMYLANISQIFAVIEPR